MVFHISDLWFRVVFALEVGTQRSIFFYKVQFTKITPNVTDALINNFVCKFTILPSYKMHFKKLLKF
jgi:hypothetical protein